MKHGAAMRVGGVAPMPGGVAPKNNCAVCGPLPKTLTLVMINIWDFPYPIYDLKKKFLLKKTHPV